MKLPSSSSIVMLVCGIALLYISMVIAGINFFGLKGYYFIIQPLYSFSTVLYFTELALMSYVLYLTNDPIRAISYFVYTGIGIINTIAFTIFANNVFLFQVLGVLNMVCLFNIVVQSFLIKNIHLSTPYRIFTLSLAGVIGVKMMVPYLAQALFLPMNDIGRISSITDLISSGFMLYVVIKIYFLHRLEAKAG